jgi:hypothetical protein
LVARWPSSPVGRERLSVACNTKPGVAGDQEIVALPGVAGAMVSVGAPVKEDWPMVPLQSIGSQSFQSGWIRPLDRAALSLDQRCQGSTIESVRV